MRKSILCLLLLSFQISKLFSQFEWNHTDGPPGAWLSGLYTNDHCAFLPKNDFLFRTGDGIHWEKIEHISFYRLAIHGDTLIHINPDPNLSSIFLTISTDNGNSWIERELPPSISSVSDIAVNSQDIFLAHPFHTYYSLFRSKDFGQTWDTMPSPVQSGGFNLRVFDNRLYLDNLSKLYRLDELGEHWEEIILPIQSLPQQYMDDFVVRDTNIIFTTEDYLFHSHDNGASWYQENFISLNSNGKLAMTNSYVYADMHLMLLRTADFGLHWDTIALSDDYPAMLSLGGFKDVFLGSTYNKGIYKWDEFQSRMIESNQGLGKGAIYDISSGNDLIWTACGNGVFNYNTNSGNWSDAMELPQPRNEYEFVSSNETGWVVAGGIYSDSFFLSENSGETWKSIKTELFIDDLQLLDENIFVFDEWSLYRSIDKGQHFERVHENILMNDIVLFKGKYYLPGYDDSLYVSTDKGITWYAIADPIGISRLNAAGDRLFALAMGTVEKINLFVSDDGIQWTNANDGFPEINYYDFFNSEQKSFFYRDANYYYAFLGLDSAYFSPIDPIQWTPFEIESHTDNIILHDHMLYRGDEGVYSSEIENPFITGISAPETKLTPKFTLFPNPTTGEIKVMGVDFDDLNDTNQVMVFDALGIKIREVYTVGNTINLSVLPPGIYFVKIADSIEKIIKL